MISTYTDDLGRETFLPFNLPTGKSGRIKITTEMKPKGSVLPVVSWRNAIFMGLKPQSVRLSEDTFIHRLSEDEHGTWMTTIPQELEQHNRQLERAHGHVLLGGLGLGVACGILSRNRRVKSITVIEKNPNVIKLVKPHLPRTYDNKPIKVIKDDLRVHLQMCKATGSAYDFAFYDTWCPTGEHVLFTDILPLRRLSQGILPNDQIECWNEEEMRGQVYQSLVSLSQWAMMMAAQPDHRVPDLVHGLSKSDFRRTRRARRMVFPFMRWMRTEGVSYEDSRSRIDEYMEDLRDPAIYDAKWGQYFK